MPYIQILLTIVLSFITVMLIDKLICSKWFNVRYTRKCVRSLNRLPDEQREQITAWLKNNIVPALDREASGKEIIARIPLEYRHKIKEKQIIGFMKEQGYDYLSSCFLDPPCFAVKFVKE